MSGYIVIDIFRNQSYIRQLILLTNTRLTGYKITCRAINNDKSKQAKLPVEQLSNS